MKYLVLALLALTALCAVEARMIPIGFHGAIAGNLDSLLTQLKTQEELGATDSQILGPGTYFGITPGIAIEYAHTRMKNFNVHDSIVAILGIDEAHFKMGLKNDVKTGVCIHSKSISLFVSIRFSRFIFVCAHGRIIFPISYRYVIRLFCFYLVVCNVGFIRLGLLCHLDHRPN